MTVLTQLRTELTAMRVITDRAPWGGGLRSLPATMQEDYHKHHHAFCKIADEAKLTELRAIRLCNGSM